MNNQLTCSSTSFYYYYYQSDYYYYVLLVIPHHTGHPDIDYSKRISERTNNKR